MVYPSLNDLQPFFIGLFYGISKPISCKEYLSEFIDGFITLQKGIKIGNCTFKIVVHAVICDAPAKAFVKCVKSYSGYSGCDKCCQRGVWNRKMTFPEIDCCLRTDESFHSMMDKDLHLGISPFTELGIGMVSSY